jgi:4-amino-4-deoxy-L-arabinose transferase-like glycosyltransferase
MDPLLLLSITASAYGIVRAGDDATGRQGAADLWLWGGVAGGVMSKGLPGLAFPLGLLTLWALVHRDGGVWRRVRTPRGVIGAALLVLPWHVLAARRVPGFLQFYLVDNQLLRFLGARAYEEDGRSLGTAAFLGVTACALLPWTPYLTAALWRALRGEARDPRCRFLLGWIAAVMGFFSVSSFKLEYYALPAFPAIALVVAVVICQASAGAAANSPKDAPTGSVGHGALLAWTRISLWGGMVYCLGMAWVWWAGWLTPRAIIRGLSFWSTNYRIILDHDLPLPPVTPGPYGGVLLAGGVLWVAAFGVASWCLARGRVLTSAAAVGGAGLGLCLLAGAVLHEVGPHHSLKPLADHLTAVHQPGDMLIHERGLEKGGGLLFYTRRPVLILDGRRGDLEFGSGLPEAAGRFIDARQFREIWSGEARAFLVTDLPASQSAISRMAAAVPTPVASTGTRWLYANRSVR